jgi:hypothetical protein
MSAPRLTFGRNSVLATLMFLLAASTRQRAATRSARWPIRSTGRLSGTANVHGFSNCGRRYRAAIRTLAEQHRQARTCRVDRHDRHRPAAFGAGDFGVALLELDLVVDAGGHALMRQVRASCERAQFGLRDVLLRIGIAQLHIGARDIAGQLDARSTAFDLGGTRLAQRASHAARLPPHRSRPS